MYTIKFLTDNFLLILTLRKKDFVAPARNFFTMLLVALMLLVPLANKTMASEYQETDITENIDSKWLPWIGYWHLISNKVNTNESSLKKEYLLTIEPGSNGNSVTMKGQRDDKILVEEEIIADGLQHPLTDKKCSGYYMYSWSETGKRLLFNSESNCPGNTQHKISGMSIINDNRDWLDIQLLQTGSEKAISIRRYRSVDNGSIIPGRYTPDKIGISRIAAGKNFSIDEIIELSKKIEPEVLEAALLEIRKPFPINSKQLIKLSDSGVDSRVVDLMVALTFPEKFTVGQEAVSLMMAERPGNNYPRYRFVNDYYSYYCPILPWHWTSSSYMSYIYGYSYYGWYLTDGRYYPLWTHPPVYYYDGGGGGGSIDKGTLIKRHGYIPSSGNTGSTSRRAQPRNAPVAQSVPVQSSSSSYSGGTG